MSFTEGVIALKIVTQIKEIKETKKTTTSMKKIFEEDSITGKKCLQTF